MREVVGHSDIQPLLTQARQITETDVQKLHPGDARRVRRRHPRHPGPAPQGRSAGRRHRLVPRRAGGPRRPGAHPERSADLRQQGGAGSARPGLADHRGGQRLSRPDHRRGAAVRPTASPRSTRATRLAPDVTRPAHVPRDDGTDLRRHGQGHPRRARDGGRASCPICRSIHRRAAAAPALLRQAGAVR